MKHLTVRVSDSIYENLAFLMEKWEANQSQALRLCIIYQTFAEQGEKQKHSIAQYLQMVSQMKEALDEDA